MAAAQSKVTIVGGDPVIGEVLEVLLQAAGYLARFLSEPAIDELGELLAGCQLLIIAPTLSAERREALIDIMLSSVTPVKIPILELLPANGGEQHLQGEHTVLWPCPIEELKRAIDDVLLAQG
jgi:hypothetical protein